MTRVSSGTTTITRRSWYVPCEYGHPAPVGEVLDAMAMAKTAYHRDVGELTTSDDWLHVQAPDEDIEFFYEFQKKEKPNDD